MKKFFALLLCLLMCVSLLPVTSFAEGAYRVSVTGGTADRNTADEGTVIKVTADVPENKTFKEWTSSPDVVFSDPKAASASFSMPADNVSIEAVFDHAVAGNTYRISVTNGTANPAAAAAAGSNVTITASALEGKTFREWTGTGGVIFADKNSPETSFTMPQSDVEIEATYVNEAVNEVFEIRMTNGTSTPEAAAAGATVTVKASVPEGKVFKEWTGTDGVIFADKDSAETSFTMPQADVEIEATYTDETENGRDANAAVVSNDRKGPDDTDNGITLTVTGGQAEPENPTAGSKVRITANIPVGMAFKEWKCKTGGVNFSSATTNPAEFTMPANDVEIEAVFVYTVTFDTVLPSGITIQNAPLPQTVLPDGTATKPLDPSDAAQHHKFLGWYKSDGTEFKFDTKINSNITLYAGWKHPYDEGICCFCWKAEPDFSEVKQPGFKPAITRGIIGKPPSTAHYGSSHSFTVDTYYPYVKNSVDVYVDGKWIKPDDQYKLKEGSTIVTLRPWYIKTLAEGEHSIMIDSNLGSAKGVFRVSKSPKTADDSNIALWVMTGVISAAAVAGIAYYLVKKRKK